MPTKTCPNCNQQVPEIAYKCIHCDHIFEQTSRKSSSSSFAIVNTIMLVLFVLAVLVIGYMLLRPKQTAQPRLASNELRVSKTQYGDTWPFTISEGILKCENQRVTFTSLGHTYAVNGTAETFGDYEKLEIIWADNPAVKGTKISIAPILNAGLKLCK